jgi:hypothetical protein
VSPWLEVKGAAAPVKARMATAAAWVRRMLNEWVVIKV